MTSKKNVMVEAALDDDVEKTPCGERASAALPRPRLVLVGSTAALVLHDEPAPLLMPVGAAPRALGLATLVCSTSNSRTKKPPEGTGG
jgi:hypothetical protein